MIECKTVPGGTRVELTVGRPGEVLPSVDTVLDAVRGLSSSVRDRLVLTLRAAEPEGRVSLAQQVADALDEEVRVQHGELTLDPDGVSRWTAVDAQGRPSWRPFSQLCSYRPGSAGAAVERWNAPFPGAELVGPARYRLTPEWVLDVVPAGLLVRPLTAAPDPVLSSVATHPERVDLIVDVGPGTDGAGTTVPDSVLCALGRVGDTMAAPARARLRVVVTPGVAPASEKALRWAVPAPQVRWKPPEPAVRGRPPVVEPALGPASRVVMAPLVGEPRPEMRPSDPLPPSLAEGLAHLVPVRTTELEHYQVDPVVRRERRRARKP